MVIFENKYIENVSALLGKRLRQIPPQITETDLHDAFEKINRLDIGTKERIQLKKVIVQLAQPRIISLDNGE